MWALTKLLLSPSVLQLLLLLIACFVLSPFSLFLASLILHEFLQLVINVLSATAITIIS